MDTGQDINIKLDLSRGYGAISGQGHSGLGGLLKVLCHEIDTFFEGLQNFISTFCVYADCLQKATGNTGIPKATMIMKSRLRHDCPSWEIFPVPMGIGH